MYTYVRKIAQGVYKPKLVSEKNKRYIMGLLYRKLGMYEKLKACETQAQVESIQEKMQGINQCLEQIGDIGLYTISYQDGRKEYFIGIHKVVAKKHGTFENRCDKLQNTFQFKDWQSKGMSRLPYIENNHTLAEALVKIRMYVEKWYRF